VGRGPWNHQRIGGSADFVKRRWRGHTGILTKNTIALKIQDPRRENTDQLYVDSVTARSTKNIWPHIFGRNMRVQSVQMESVDFRKRRRICVSKGVRQDEGVVSVNVQVTKRNLSMSGMHKMISIRLRITAHIWLVLPANLLTPRAYLCTPAFDHKVPRAVCA